MIKKVIAVYDTVAKVYGSPMFLVTNGEGIRSFSDAVNDPGVPAINKHPADYIMYEIGSYDDSTGELVPLIPPNRLAIGSDFVKLNGKEIV